LLLHFSQHLPDYNRAVESVGNLGMPAAQDDTQFPAGSRKLGEDLLHLGRPRLTFGQKEGRQEPPGDSSRGGNVVGVDVDRVPADLVRREGDGVCLRCEVFARKPRKRDDSGVSSYPGLTMTVGSSRYSARKRGEIFCGSFPLDTGKIVPDSTFYPQVILSNADCNKKAGRQGRFRIVLRRNCRGGR
jgi:hypothetical protein